MVRNTYIYPPGPSMRIVADIIEHTASAHAALQLDLDLRLPHAGGRGDGRPGAGLHHRRRARVRPGGHATAASTSTTFAPRLSFFFAIGMNLFMEVAKLRAARLLWARVMPSSTRRTTTVAHAAHPLPDLAACRSPSRTRTTTSSAPRYEALAAVLGGTQSLHTNAFDEALGLPTDSSAKHRPQHAADPRRGDRRAQGRRPAGGQLLRREAHPRPGRPRPGPSSRRSRSSAG